MPPLGAADWIEALGINTVDMAHQQRKVGLPGMQQNAVFIATSSFITNQPSCDEFSNHKQMNSQHWN
jgi:hypothetical protein